MLRSNQLSYVAKWRALFSGRFGLSTLAPQIFYPFQTVSYERRGRLARTAQVGRLGRGRLSRNTTALAKRRPRGQEQAGEDQGAADPVEGLQCLAEQ